VNKWLSFTPRDTVFVRDGRSFDAAADTSAVTVRPWPTTIAGAVGAVFRGNNPAEVRGPVLAHREGSGWEPYFPVPADLVVSADITRRVHRLQPLEPAGSSGTDLDMHRWLMPPQNAGKVESFDEAFPGCLIPGRVLVRYLAGALPASGTTVTDLKLRQPLWPEVRVGLAREGRAVRSGYLYQAAHLRLEDDWAFLAEVTLADGQECQDAEPVPFGGRGRLADVDAVDVSWPDAGTAQIGRRVLVYLATPAVWLEGWRPPLPAGATLVAAATGKPQPATTLTPGRTWRDTRVLRWAVPAGSVYLLEFEDDAAGAEWARAWQARALDRGGTSGEDLVRTAGFGVVLMGAWT
jgi:CRISPR type III-B/RAMP module-associated protein Cmr3